MSEVVKDLIVTETDEETWSTEARDILLDTWTALLAVFLTMEWCPSSLLILRETSLIKL